MKRSAFVLLVASFALLAMAESASAHHSFAAAYDTTKEVTVQGAIVQIRLTNPHSWFFIDVKDEATGKLTRWSFEAGTPSGMIRNGYKASELKAGTVVTIKGFHARDASQNVGMLQQLTTADGKTYGMFGPQQGAAGQ
jgi:hypothetical protein